MTYPPPPALTILAYMNRKISHDEFIFLLELWHEKNELKEKT